MVYIRYDILFLYSPKHHFSNLSRSGGFGLINIKKSLPWIGKNTMSVSKYSCCKTYNFMNNKQYCLACQEVILTSFWVWVQPMRDDITLQRRRSLAESIRLMITEKHQQNRDTLKRKLVLYLPVCPLSNFRSHRFVQNPFGYYTNLLFYLILYLTLYKMLVLTYLFPKIHTPSSIGIVYIYFIIALVFIMICILHVIYCRTIAPQANVTCWL